jgi:hypothetical protein
MSRSYTSSPPSASMACSGTALLLLFKNSLKDSYFYALHKAVVFVSDSQVNKQTRFTRYEAQNVFVSHYLRHPSGWTSASCVSSSCVSLGLVRAQEVSCLYALC